MDAPYRVVYPGNVLEAFAQVCDDAIDLGAMSAVESAAEAIHLQLQINPRVFGDPVYTLPATKQSVYLRGYPPLFVYLSPFMN